MTDPATKISAALGRIAPVALYSTFEDVWRVAQALKEIIDLREYERFGKGRKAVS